MARSSSSSSGLASPWLIGALTLLAMGTFFGDDLGVFSPSNSSSRMAELEGIADALAPDIPVQTPLEAAARPLGAGGHVAEPRYAFALDALILSRKAYRFDEEAAVSPLDLMLGWGPMSNPAVVSVLRTRQSRRFGYLRTAPGSEMNLDELSPFWTNVHVIAADSAVAVALDGLVAGQVVRLEGALVDVAGPDGWWWRTSTSRTDRGAGACEILLVTSVEVLR